MNELKPIPSAPPAAEHRKVEGWERVRRGYVQYLADESRMAAERVEVIHFPATAEQVAAAVRAAREAGRRVAVSGARTGITGAAVPLGADEVISLEQLKHRPVVRRDGDRWLARVAAGTTLDELNDALAHGLCGYPDGKPPRPLFYPVDTTETTAHVGGTIATDASGARTLHYGSTRDWVEWLRLVTPDGRLLELRRGQVRADGGRLVYVRPDGERVELTIPDLPMPATKHTAGYHLAPDMDALDLFIGSEGTLGIVVEAELRLAEKPPERLFLTQFVPGPDAAVDFVLACKADEAITPLALEYIGPRALDLLRSKGRQTPAYMEVARLPEDVAAAVYLEMAFDGEGELDAAYDALLNVLGPLGLDQDDSWAGFAEKDLEEMKRLRHAIPEAVNAIIGRRQAEVPGLHKVGTDMAVPDEHLREMMAIYRRRLDECGLEHVIFGHVGNGHLHVNILPSTPADLQRAEELYAEFARDVVRLGGSVAAEHGIGRIKKPFLAIQYADEHIDAMRAIRRALDPKGTLNPGVLFD
ncbi:MAG: FAD-binding oxidoreductase [Candidatus Brocadiia bacterium]